MKSRNGKNYYLRGTYTHFNPHFAEDTLDMTKIGKELSVEPVVGIDEPYVLTEADLPVLYEEYDKLARLICKSAVKAMLLIFSILMLLLVTDLVWLNV